MPVIVGKEQSSVTLNHYKGNAFSQAFTVSGLIPPTSAIAIISRIQDPDRVGVISFLAGSGLSISGQDIILSKTSAEMVLPPGKYAFYLEAVIDGVSMALVKDSFFVIRDEIKNVLEIPDITATVLSSSAVDLDWTSVLGATGYRLYRSTSMSGPWTLRYEGPDLAFSDTGLSASTQYFWRVEPTGPGYDSSGYGYTNATTLAAGFLVEWAWMAGDPYAALLVADDIVYNGSTTLPVGSDLVVDLRSAPVNSYNVIKYPLTESAKTEWFNDIFNNGTLPDSNYREPLVLHGSRYIVSRVALTLNPDALTNFS